MSAEIVEQLKAMNETQAGKIKAQWMTITRLEKQVKVQQWIIDRQREDSAPTAQDIAEQFFKEPTHG